MSSNKFFQAAAGTAAAGGAGGLNVEDVFSTYLYKASGISRRIENGINIGDGTEEKTVIHLTGDSIADSGPNSISLSNSSVVVSSSIKKFGTASLYFDANNNSRLTATDVSLNSGSGDFTIEMWLYIPNANEGTKGIFAFSNPADDTQYDIGLYHDGYKLHWQTRYSPAYSRPTYSSGANTISNNTWHHVALVRYNDYHYMYIDGSLQGTPLDVTGQEMGWSHLKLGTHWTDQYCFTGRIDEFRISHKALYTSNFTPPTAAFSTSYTSTTGEGGLVWIKNRDNVESHYFIDTERGTSSFISSNSSSAATTLPAVQSSDYKFSFNSDGFSIYDGSPDSGETLFTDRTYASWTFRKAPKFFDVVTYTGDGNANTVINHNLGSTPGVIITKRIESGGWGFFHRSLGTGKYLNLDATWAAATDSNFFPEVTSTGFRPGSDNDVNGSGYTYVAYLFAHNDGDGEFGPDGDADIIKCGSYTGNGQSFNNFVDLGFEPQFLLLKNASNNENWWMFDNMRGVATGGDDARLLPNTTSAESSFDNMEFNATGFTPSANNYVNGSGNTMVYIAIRRGPMAVPTDATDVFAVVVNNNGNQTQPLFLTGFVTDMTIEKQTSGGSGYIFNRVTGDAYMNPDATSSEGIGAAVTWDYMDGMGESASGNWYAWNWKRAPNYFDVVAYTGEGTKQTISHNLGVAPEMMWIKVRSTTQHWAVYHPDLPGSGKFISLNNTWDGNNTNSTFWDGETPTSTTFSVGATGVNNLYVNGSGNTYIAYLFASLDGVSKVGSFTHTSGTATNVDCGFSSGARFILVKRSSASGDWMVWDTERGIVAGDDPYLELNNTNAEITGDDLVDPLSSGFSFASGNSDGTYIFYAIA